MNAHKHTTTINIKCDSLVWCNGLSGRLCVLCFVVSWVVQLWNLCECVDIALAHCVGLHKKLKPQALSLSPIWKWKPTQNSFAHECTYACVRARLLRHWHTKTKSYCERTENVIIHCSCLLSTKNKDWHTPKSHWDRASAREQEIKFYYFNKSIWVHSCHFSVGFKFNVFNAVYANIPVENTNAWRVCLRESEMQIGCFGVCLFAAKRMDLKQRSVAYPHSFPSASIFAIVFFNGN